MTTVAWSSAWQSKMRARARHGCDVAQKPLRITYRDSAHFKASDHTYYHLASPSSSEQPDPFKQYDLPREVPWLCSQPLAATSPPSHPIPLSGRLTRAVQRTYRKNISPCEPRHHHIEWRRRGHPCGSSRLHPQRHAALLLLEAGRTQDPALAHHGPGSAFHGRFHRRGRPDKTQRRLERTLPQIQVSAPHTEGSKLQSALGNLHSIDHQHVSCQHGMAIESTVELTSSSSFLHFLTALFHEVKDRRHEHRQHEDGYVGDKERTGSY